MKETSIFNKDFFIINGKAIKLELIDTYEGSDNKLPFYW